MAKKNLPYGPVNIRMFRRIQKLIEEEPKRLNMEWWGTNYSQDDIRTDPHAPPCGTAACICGWANTLNAWDNNKKIRSHQFANMRKAGEILGLELEEIRRFDLKKSHTIFFVDTWPDKYLLRYYKAKNHLQRVKVVSSFIDYICGGKRARRKAKV